MSAVSLPALVSVQDYLDAELQAEQKHEYLGGVIHAMAGATNRHNEVASNALIALGSRLRGKPCRPYNSDTKLRVRTSTQTRFYYPDASVVCERSDAELTYQDHPVVILEVLSPSTRRIDEGEKRDAYLQMPDLRVYAMAESDTPHVRVDRRAGTGFVQEVHEGLDATIPLPEIGIELPLREMYDA